MTDTQIRLGDFGFAGDDNVVPFQVDALDVRGRAVQLGPVLDALLPRHNYPEPVGALLAEVMVMTVLLGTTLKFQGKLILQTRTDGPVDLLVADFSAPQSLRAYARFDVERLEAAMAEGRISAPDLLGKGVLALTLDQGAHMQRYQGVVQLDGASLEEVARSYFRQSEQIPTEIRLAVTRQTVPGDDGPVTRWRAGGLLAQFLPEAPERMRPRDLPGGDGDNGETHDPFDDAWNEVRSLIGTISPDELFDPTVSPERLLYRLFHEHGVRVFDAAPIVDECTCSREKIRGILDGFTAEEILESTVEGAISVDCEFCSKRYEFEPADFAPAK